MNELNFNFNEVEDFKGRIEPGVEECTITGISMGESVNKKQYIEVGLISLDGNREHKEQFYVSSEKGTKMTMLRLKHIIKTLIGEAKANTSYNFDQLVAVLTGLKGRFLFFGEEYMYNGEIRVRTNLAFLNFVEPLSITKENSKLKYDPNNKNHLKKLPEMVTKEYEKKEDTDKFEDENF